MYKLILYYAEMPTQDAGYSPLVMGLWSHFFCSVLFPQESLKTPVVVSTLRLLL